jgi:kumamolisin
LKPLIRVTILLAAVCAASAQPVARKSPAGEPPIALRNGKARVIGRFNPQQTIRLAIGLSHPHPQEEEEFVHSLSDPSSPNYRKFLTLDEWNTRFGPSVEDEQAVVDWAVAQGLTVTHRFRNRLIVDVQAPVSTVERSLQLTINNYVLESYTYFSNDREPVIPSHLTRVIQSIGGLNNFPEMRPANFRGIDAPPVIYRPGPVVGEGVSGQGGADHSARRRGIAQDGSHSEMSTNFTNGLIDPKNIYSSSAYNYDGLQHFGLCCNPLSPGNPAGSPKESSIALATFGNLHYDGTNFTDVVQFHNTHPYLAWNITQIPIDGGAGSCTVTSSQPCNNDGETALDAEWSTATSNSFGSHLDTAHVYVYSAGGSAEDMYNAMFSDDHARVFSTSWSCTENAGCASGSTMDTRHGIFNGMAAVGWTLMTASGDRGSTDDCSSTDVSYPASDPTVIGVGGTLLGLFNDGSFASEVAWTGGTNSGACSKNNGGSGGGCSVHFGTPGFQSGANGTCGSKRSVPDISLNAAAGQDFVFNGNLGGVGGTSISSPMLAGFFAQAEAYLLYIGSITGNNCGTVHLPCTPIGAANPYLYFFGKNPDYAPHYPFYDITSGCNSNDITTSNSQSFFCSAIGYDSVTGWGTANMLQLSWAINTYFAGDSAPPNASFTGPVIGNWYNTTQNLHWSLTDQSFTGAKPVGVAGYTAKWDSDPGDDSRKSTPGTESAYYTGPSVALASSGNMSLNGGSGGEGCHTLHVRSWDNSGFSGDQTYGPVCFDDIPPLASCQSPDGLWHATDVSLHCTASDSLSGLANGADASFNLVTSVAAGTETSNASTNSRTIFDVAGNSVTKGPISGNKVDKKAPAVSCGAPDGLWHATDVSIPCTATDGGSGLANPSDASFNLTTSVPAGTETATANTNSHAVPDAVGNTTTAGPIGPNKVDKKPPVITIVQPAATNYTHSSTLTLNYTVTDGGSGLASFTPTMNGNLTVNGISLANGSSIPLLANLPLGNNTFSITATDNVGNTGTTAVTFTIIVTAQSMMDDVNQLAGSGAIDPNEVNSLLAKLSAAADQRSKGNCNSSGNQYQAFINEVNAQTGQSITPAAAAILIADAQYLITHCP